MKILIADDQREVADLLMLSIGVGQHEIVGVAHTGMAAIRAYTRERPDVVIMDYCMPHLNGATACRQIVSRNPRAKVILLSGWIRSDDPLVSESGAVAMLAKPFEMRELNRLLSRIEASLN